MAQNSPSQNPRINRLIELEVEGKIKPEHQQELDTYRAQGFAPKKTGLGQTREGEDKASAFITRALGANVGYEAAKQGARSLVGQTFRDTFPNAANYLASDERQVADSAQDEFIAATLRQDSGAAIPDDELDRQRRIYFPMPGDSEAAIAQKRSARLRAISGLVQSAGRALNPKTIEALKPYQADIDAAIRGEVAKPDEKVTPPSGATPPIDPQGIGDIGFNTPGADQANALPQGAADFQRELQDLIARGVLTTPEQVIQYGKTSKLNDGRGFVIPPEQAEAAFKEGARVEVATPRFELPAIDPERKNAILDPAIRGAADVATLGMADEIAAAGNTVFNGGTMRENLARERAVDQFDTENNLIPRLTGQVAGGLLLPSRIGAAGTSAREAAIAGGEAPNLAALAGARAMTRRGALEGGAYGAGYGFGSGDSLSDRVSGAATSGVTGLALGAGLGKLSEIYTGRRGGGAGPQGGDPNFPGGSGDILDVAGRLGIARPTPSATGGRGALAVESGLSAAPGSLSPVAAAREAEAEALGGFAGETAARLGAVAPDRASIGETVTRGARVADRTAARAAGRQYTARDTMMGGAEAPVSMAGTQRELSAIGSDFGSNETVRDLLTHPLIRRLSNAEASDLTLAESTELLSEARRVLRQARQKEAPGRLINQLQRLEGAVEGDVMRAAQMSDEAAGRSAEEGAAAAMVRADSMWAERMRARKAELGKAMDAINPGKTASGEDAYEQMLSDMKLSGGNMTRFKRMMGKLPQRARDSFSATLFDELGTAKAGAQNAAGEAWSPETFMTSWNNLSPEAKRLAFGGRGVDREIGDILRYAERLRDVNRARNTSNTAPTAAQASYLTAIGYSLASGKPIEAAKVAAIYPSMSAVSRAFLAVPAARQWLRSALSAETRGNDAQVQTLARRLPALAARNPQIANEIGLMEQALLRASNDNMVGRAAASGNGQEE